jgi:uncharacterized protein YqhQ
MINQELEQEFENGREDRQYAVANAAKATDAKRLQHTERVVPSLLLVPLISHVTFEALDVSQCSE